VLGGSGKGDPKNIVGSIDNFILSGSHMISIIHDNEF
jgi:hypothetical protein